MQASKYRTEFESHHNTALPTELFQLPWEPPKPAPAPSSPAVSD